MKDIESIHNYDTSLQSLFSKRLPQLILQFPLIPCPGRRKQFFVYILQNLKDFSFYVGQCADSDKPMSKHFGESNTVSKYFNLKIDFYRR
jgi:hypothetical protein